MKKNKNGALEFSFAWIFAIIAGLFIIFLAIYGVTKFIGLENAAGNAESAKDIGVLMNPLESSFEALKRTMMTTPVETRIYTTCSNNSLFGEQTIRTSQKIYNKWSDEGVDVAFQNKYIFSKDPVDGKNFYLFSESFEVPFKVADLIYLTSASDKYCFLNSPNDVEQEIKALKGSIISPNENFFLFTNSVDCPDGSIKVCFKRGVRNCPIEVYTQSNFVVKDGKTMYYQGNALMYAAIFSNKEGLIRSGSSATVRIPEELHNVLVIPQSATYELQNKIFAYRVDSANKVTAVAFVDPLPSDNGQSFFVSNGIKPGDKIVVAGINSLKNGATIIPKEAAEKNDKQ